MSAKAIELATEAVAHGWTVRITPGEDSGGNPFVIVDAVRGLNKYVSVTWHTRSSGTYRLFNARVGKRGPRVSIARVRAELVEP